MKPVKRALPCEESGECAVDTGAAVLKGDVGIFRTAGFLKKLWPLLVFLAAVGGFALNAEMKRANSEQNAEIEAKFVTRAEFNARLDAMRDSLSAIASEQKHQRDLLERALGVHKEAAK